MVLTNEEIDRAEAEIQSILSSETEPIRPTVLFELLQKRGISEILARAAVWYLIDRNLVDLTSKRLLALAGTDTPGTARVAPLSR